MKFPVGILFKVPQEPGVQLLLVQGRLQVDLQPVVRAAHAPHLGAGREHQGPGDPEVGKEHLPQLPEDQLSVIVGRERHVPQGEALHLGAIRVRALQGHQGGPQRRHRMAQLFGDPIARPVGAGLGIAEAAGAEGRRPAVDPPLVGENCRHRAVFRQDLPGGFKGHA